MSSWEAEKEGVPPLQVWATVVNAYQIAFSRFLSLAIIAAIPTLVSISMALTGNSFVLPYPNVLWVFSLALPWTLLGVSWTRLILLPEGRSTVRFLDRPGRRHLRFLVYTLVLTCINLPLLYLPYLNGYQAAPDPVRGVAYFGVLSAVVYVKCRFVFVLVGIAVDETHDLRQAWSQSRKCGLRLFLAVIIAVIVPWKVFNYCMGLLDLADMGLALAAMFVWHALLWVINAIYLTVVAMAFRDATGWVPGPDKDVLERFE